MLYTDVRFFFCIANDSPKEQASYLEANSSVQKNIYFKLSKTRTRTTGYVILLDDKYEAIRQYPLSIPRISDIAIMHDNANDETISAVCFEQIIEAYKLHELHLSIMSKATGSKPRKLL